MLNPYIKLGTVQLYYFLSWTSLSTCRMSCMAYTVFVQFDLWTHLHIAAEREVFPKWVSLEAIVSEQPT